MTPGKQRPLISVVIPTYNRAHCVHEAIESVLAQTFTDYELIVVDDGSKDDTASAVKPYLGKINYIRQTNQGVSVARNTGIQAAVGEWIALLDSDDLWRPGKLELQAAEAAKSPKACLHVTNATLERSHLGERFEIFGTPVARKFLDGCQGMLERPLLAQMQAGLAWVQTSLIKRLVALESGLFDPGFRIYEDVKFFYNLALRGPWLVSEKPQVDILRRKEEVVNVSSRRTSSPKESCGNFVSILRGLLDSGRLSAEEKEYVTTRISQELYKLAFLEAGGGDRKTARSLSREGFKFVPSAGNILKSMVLRLPGGMVRNIVRRKYGA